jgi:hypothetical protein
MYSGKISKIIFPISEPIDRTPDNAGNHWTVGVIDCGRMEVFYLNSLQSLSGFDPFKKVGLNKVEGTNSLDSPIIQQYIQIFLDGRAKTEKKKFVQWKYHDCKVGNSLVRPYACGLTTKYTGPATGEQC